MGHYYFRIMQLMCFVHPFHFSSFVLLILYVCLFPVNVPECCFAAIHAKSKIQNSDDLNELVKCFTYDSHFTNTVGINYRLDSHFSFHCRYTEVGKTCRKILLTPKCILKRKKLMSTNFLFLGSQPKTP